MDELSLAIAVEPLADEVPADVGEAVEGEDGLPVVGDDSVPTDDEFVWDDGTIDDGTIDDIIIDDIITDDGSGEDELIGDDASDEVWLVDDGSWTFVEWYAPEDEAAWDGDMSADPIFWCTITLDESSLDYEQLSRPMFEDKGLPDGTGTSTDGLFDPAICVYFAYDAIV